MRLIDSCITLLRVQGPSRTFNDSNKEEEEELFEGVAVSLGSGTCNDSDDGGQDTDCW